MLEAVNRTFPKESPNANMTPEERAAYDEWYNGLTDESKKWWDEEEEELQAVKALKYMKNTGTFSVRKVKKGTQYNYQEHDKPVSFDEDNFDTEFV